VVEEGQRHAEAVVEVRHNMPAKITAQEVEVVRNSGTAVWQHKVSSFLGPSSK
jgi:hypothetical protein